MVIAGGIAINTTARAVELLQIDPYAHKCKNWPDLKGDASDVVGGLMNYTQPVLCHPTDQKCYWAYSGKPVRTGKMGLDYRLMSSTGVNVNRNEIYISGGWSVQNDTTVKLDTIEVLSFKDPPKRGPTMPFRTVDHCMVQFNQRQFLLIGFDQTQNKNRYFIYDLTKQQWLPEIHPTYKPRAGSTRQYCVAFKAGGRTKIFLSGYAYRTNIFDVSTQQWSRGNFYDYILLLIVEFYSIFT